jgi:hypothetical protein
MNINLHIERLVLDGLAIGSGGAALVQTAAESELARLLASELLAPASSFAEARVDAGEIRIHPGTTGRDLGVEIGRSVFRALTQSGFGLPEEAQRSPNSRLDRPARGRRSSGLVQTIQPENAKSSGRDLRSGAGLAFGLNKNQQPKEIICQNQK